MTAQFDLFGEAIAESTPATVSTAELSDDGVYRYTLTRTWDPNADTALFVMLNPSKADHQQDDNTIRRCRGFAEREGCGGFKVVNLYAYRATKPPAMWAAERAGVDIAGPKNAQVLADVIADARRFGGPVIVAWGANGRPERVTEFAREHGLGGMSCLGLTSAGMPCHPLMLRADTPLVPFSWSRES